MFLTFTTKAANSCYDIDASSWQGSCLWTLAILSQLTYIFPTRCLTESAVCHCVARSICPLYICFLGMAPCFSTKKEFYCLQRLPLCHTHTRTNAGTAAQRAGCGNSIYPVVNNACCQKPQILYVKNNIHILLLTKASEWLILKLLPWLEVRVLVCKTTISLFTDTGPLRDWEAAPAFA